MTPTDMHHSLDINGWLADSHNSGIYALTVDVPSAVDAVQTDWLASQPHPLPDDYAERLAAAKQTYYVGRSTDIYSRLMDHARGHKRQASFVSAFALSSVRGVWADDSSGVAERDRARQLSTPSVVVWCDGELF